MGMPNISFGINPTEELITKLQSDKPSLTPDAIEGRLNQQSAAVKDLKASNKQAVPIENRDELFDLSKVDWELTTEADLYQHQATGFHSTHLPATLEGEVLPLTF